MIITACLLDDQTYATPVTRNPKYRHGLVRPALRFWDCGFVFCTRITDSSSAEDNMRIP